MVELRIITGTFRTCFRNHASVISSSRFSSLFWPGLSSSPLYITPLPCKDSESRDASRNWHPTNHVHCRSGNYAGGLAGPPAGPTLRSAMYENYFFLVAFFLVAFFFAFFLAAIICPPPFGIPRSDSSGLILKQSAEHRSAVTSASSFRGVSGPPGQGIPRRP